MEKDTIHMIPTSVQSFPWCGSRHPHQARGGAVQIPETPRIPDSKSQSIGQGF